MKGASAILNDQDTSVVNNDDGQISIGSVPPGWSDYGEILVVFKVGATVVQPNYCSISNFTTNTSYVTSGNPATLSWNTSDCNSVTVYPTVGNTNLSGSQTVYPTTSTTYTLTAYGSTGSAQTRTVTVSVNDNTYTNTPSVSTYSPTNVSTTSATLSGYANGNGSTISSWIEFPCYGTKYDNRYNQSSCLLYTSPSPRD